MTSPVRAHVRPMHVRPMVVTLAMALATTSCRHTQTPSATGPQDPAAPASVPAVAEPEPMMLDIVESEKSGHAELKKKEGRFFLSLREADLRESLIALSRDSETNLVVEPDVAGRVTVDLKNVTMEEALGFMVRPSYDYSYDGKTIRVFRPMRLTQTFKVDYVATTRTGVSQVTATASGGGGSGSGGGGSGLSSNSSVQSDFKADFWEQLELGVKAILSKDGNATVHRMAGLVTVSDYADRVESVKTYLDRLGGEVHSQVLIQAELVEVSLEDSLEAGVDWQKVSNLLGGAVTAAHDGPDTPGTGLRLQFAQGVSNFAILRALARQGKVEVLSRPRILTLNNQKALMKVGREDVFFSTTLVPSLTGATGAAGLAGSAGLPLSVSEPRTITVGILLDVSPQIRANGRVALHVHLSITEKFGTATSPDQRSTAPILDVREADAMVEVASGQTLAIGGLTQIKETNVKAGVPILSSIPVLGALFRHTFKEKRKVELVLLMTPTVVKPQRPVSFDMQASP